MILREMNELQERLQEESLETIYKDSSLGRIIISQKKIK